MSSGSGVVGWPFGVQTAGNRDETAPLLLLIFWFRGRHTCPGIKFHGREQTGGELPELSGSLCAVSDLGRPFEDDSPRLKPQYPGEKDGKRKCKPRELAAIHADRREDLKCFSLIQSGGPHNNK